MAFRYFRIHNNILIFWRTLISDNAPPPLPSKPSDSAKVSWTQRWYEGIGGCAKWWTWLTTAADKGQNNG
jgi:hypothetical protein